MIKLLSANLLIYLASISSVYAFTCYDSMGNTLNSESGSGTSNVYVNLQPSVEAGQNLVVDLSQSIFCRNDYPDFYKDEVSIIKGSTYGGAL